MKHRLSRLGVALGAVLALAAGVARSAEPQKYLRFAEEGDRQQLQTSIVTFENADGAKVDLIGAVHVADRPYYDDLNERFKKYDALLYEMVKPKGMKGVAAKAADKDGEAGGDAPRGMSWISMVQQFMKTQLELDFQLDRVDYSPANFVHADLDAETFAERQAARGESMLTLMLNQMLRELNKPAAAAGEEVKVTAGAMGLLDLIEALQSPDRGRQLKLVLARQFESMDEALDSMGGPGGSVILDERNKEALKVLRRELDAGKKNIGIFYGAGHMRGMEETMTDLMGFKQVGEPEWLVAWDMGEPTTRPAAKPINPANKPAKRPAMAQ